MGKWKDIILTREEQGERGREKGLTRGRRREGEEVGASLHSIINYIILISIHQTLSTLSCLDLPLPTSFMYSLRSIFDLLLSDSF